MLPQIEELPELRLGAGDICLAAICLGQMEARQSHSRKQLEAALIFGDRFIQPAERHIPIRQRVLERLRASPFGPVPQGFAQARQHLLRAVSVSRLLRPEKKLRSQTEARTPSRTAGD